MKHLMLHKSILLVILVFIGQYSFAQNATYHSGQKLFNPNHPIYKIENRLWSGDKNALLEVAPYLDSKKELIEYLGSHPISATESDVAKRIIEVCCLFTSDEIQIDTNTSSKDFLNFLTANWGKITYSEYAAAFLITPLEKRPIKIEFRELTESKLSELKIEFQTIIATFDNIKIQSLIGQKDPKILFVIASELYKERDWLNEFSYYINNEGYVKLLQILTHLEIAVEDWRGKMNWHIETEYHSTVALNLLCYFSANYSKFKWNQKKEIFENKKLQILPIAKEDALFELTENKNDSIAISAFIQLTTCDPLKVTELANEYEFANIKEGYGLPSFPYKFLTELVLLTEYCNENEIDFVGSSPLQASINKLKSKLSFSERRKLEDSLINNLTLEDITAFEYWASIYSNGNLTYSAGRILDVFYSKNWNKLLDDEKELNCYLKKSALFDRFGIIGICNNYLRKFINSPEPILIQLENIKTLDKDIEMQIQKVILGDFFNDKRRKDEALFSSGNYDSEVVDLEKQLKELIENTEVPSEETDKIISELLSQINYEQIPIALNMIEEFPFKSPRQKYSFMHRDWGFFLYPEFSEENSFNKKEIRTEFLDLYSKFTEYELYAYFLDKAEIDYKTNNNLDFDKIYELLKYDVVVAFAGGREKDNEVYSLIKLLEITFNTTLGFPKKFCNSNNIYGCSSDNRASAWRNYFEENNLLKKQHNEPVSFTYE